MGLERTVSKRSREEYLSDPNKRLQSPRNSALIYGNPVTPTKPKSTQRRSKLITSFKRVFSKPTFHSPVSEFTTPQSSPFIEEPSSESRHSAFIFCTPTSPSTTVSSFHSSSSFSSSPSSPCPTRNFLENFEVESKFNTLSIQPVETHPIFTIPEIMTKIISYVDCHTTLPCEESPVRRRPLSYQHALLIYKDEKKAAKIWNESLKSNLSNGGNPESQFPNKNSLFDCMLVNKLWYKVTLEVANTKHFFSNEAQWNNFVNYKKTKSQEFQRRSSDTKLFMMHKLFHARQDQIEVVAPSISGSLEWIEMYICPKVLPTPEMLSGSMLKKLILPGSKVVNDKFLKLVSKSCPLLESLDLRACPYVSDRGIISLTSRCHELQLINVGRHSKSESITDLSLVSIARNCPKISTLGFAGCSITDRGLWEIAISNSNTIQRLSLNNCTLLTNNSIPRIITNGFLQGLSVLEIRHILALTDLKPLIQFKRNQERIGHAVLIEGCEVLEYRMRQEEWQLDMNCSARMFNDIQNWVHSDDSDVDFRGVYVTN